MNPVSIICKKLLLTNNAKVSEAYEKNPWNLHAAWQIQTSLLVPLQISLGFVALFEKIYFEVPILTIFSNIREDVVHCTIPLFQWSVWCEKCVTARHDAVICKQLLISNDRNRVSWVVLGLSEDGACTELSENLSMNSLKGDLSNATTSKPPFFSLVNTFKDMTLWLTPVVPLVSPQNP